jgi:hypothetical protein
LSDEDGRYVETLPPGKYAFWKNTAKALEGNPTLMRLRELEVLERVATSGKLNVVLGEKGFADRIAACAFHWRQLRELQP